LNESILELIARVIEWCEPTRDGGRGHPPTETVRVLATLRRFLREGTPWRSLRATSSHASGSTLRRRLADWTRTGVLRHVHSMLVGMLRSQPDTALDLIVDSCSARAKLQLNPVEPPWYGPVCPVVWEGRRREVLPYPDQY
jgi:hypothetical protein